MLMKNVGLGGHSGISNTALRLLVVRLCSADNAVH
jgi:hypothetical protein